MFYVELSNDIKKRKVIHKAICKGNEEYQSLRMMYLVALAITVIICLFTALTIIFSKPLTLTVGLLTAGFGICFACIPFFIALSINHTARYKGAYPYSSYANGALMLDDEKLQYVFYKVGPNDPAAYSTRKIASNKKRMCIYSIKKEDIQTLVCEDNFCKIIGWGTLKDTLIDNTRRLDEFSFILDFEGDSAESDLKKWREIE